MKKSEHKNAKINGLININVKVNVSIILKGDFHFNSIMNKMH